MILAAVASAILNGSTAMPKPASVPPSCPVTAVERWNRETPSQYPFVRLQPSFTGITMEMQTAPVGMPSAPYRPMRSGAVVVWHGASSTVAISAARLGGTARFTAVEPTLQSGRELEFPDAGCWKLHVTSGTTTGDLVLWVAVPAPA